ncbi:hypothetical protein G9A89_002941 [Geosiphon pyriformis]|nr:hypothetical protein G9A89_002941 [Geosiphon pyriformis]
MQQRRPRLCANIVELDGIGALARFVDSGSDIALLVEVLHAIYRILEVEETETWLEYDRYVQHYNGIERLGWIFTAFSVKVVMLNLVPSTATHQCGFCRMGGRENFRHCNDCGMLIDTLLFDDHNCKAGKYMSNCPGCQEDDLFSSRDASHEMPCGHDFPGRSFLETMPVNGMAMDEGDEGNSCSKVGVRPMDAIRGSTYTTTSVLHNLEYYQLGTTLACCAYRCFPPSPVSWNKGAAGQRLVCLLLYQVAS